MLHPRHPSRPQPAGTRSAQENIHTGGIRQPAAPPATQQQVVQGVFVFDGRIVVSYPGDQPPPFWQQHYVKIFDAVYNDDVYVPIGQVEHYRATLAQVRALHPHPPAQGEAANDDEAIREQLLAVYRHHARQPPPQPSQRGPVRGRGGQAKPPRPTIEAFLKAYDELKKTRNIHKVPAEELYQEVLKQYDWLGDTLDVGAYLLHESEVENRSGQFPGIRELSQEEILKLSEGTEKVGADRWGVAVPSPKGIYTDEMAPCITVGLTANLPGGQPVSALFHSYQPTESAAYMIQSLQQAFPHFNQLGNVKYFVVGGSPESIGKAVDILRTLSAMHLDVSGVKLTTSIEERDLVKSVIVTPQGQVRYAVKKRVVHAREEPIDFGGPKDMPGPGSFAPPGFGFGFGRPSAGPGPGSSTDFTTAFNLNKEQGGSPPSGFTSAFRLNREQSTPSFSGFTSAGRLHKKENRDQEKGLND